MNSDGEQTIAVRALENQSFGQFPAGFCCGSIVAKWKRRLTRGLYDSGYVTHAEVQNVNTTKECDSPTDHGHCN